MKRKGLLLLLACLLLSISAGIGCGVRAAKGMVQKKDQKWDETEETPELSPEEERKKTGQYEGIEKAAALRVPERYSEVVYGTEANLEIITDAEIHIPSDNGFYMVPVEKGCFDGEDLKKVAGALLEGNPLYRMENPEGTDLAEIDSKLWKRETMLESPEGCPDEERIQLEDEIEELKRQREEAASKSIKKEIPLVFTEDSEGNLSVYGLADLKRGVMVFEMTESFVRLSQQSDAGRDTCTITKETAEKKADEYLDGLGLSEAFSCTYGHEAEDKSGYVFYYTRKIGGWSVNYSWQRGSQSISDDRGMDPWPYELLVMKIDDEGIYFLEYSDPYEEEERGAEHDAAAELLPFDEIISIYTRMIPQVKSYMAPGEGETAVITVDEIMLGYGRVRSEDEEAEGYLVPVWDFYGNLEVFDGDRDGRSINREQYVMISINALDGTVIDKGTGS
ncbi:DUF6034 family protein [Lacrimispora sp. NSJ-141]|uniref:DUF6034 family protein n=1 Tax=Lientehia hominis TaxID=2897778 RepID=A0AAP2RJL9_9FIRM|nr:DUF6034 family protein [Lientehia hominis]MCD2492876.1 DUF6034 family protein [Lientehia hominis]